MELSAPGGTLRIGRAPGVLSVTLARPERQNTLTAALLSDLHHALDLAQASPDCRVVTLSGAGGVFCAGMDFHEAAAPGGRGGEAFLELLKRLARVPRVVVACVDGRVAGGGVGLAAASDFVFATERSQFSLPEALWGLLPCCVAPFLVRRVGFQRAYAMALGTHPVGARQAERFHLVDEVAEDPEPLVRRLLFRLSRVEEETIGEVKAYFGKMWIISDEMEHTALRELTRILGSHVAQRRITDFVTRQKLPWDA